MAFRHVEDIESVPGSFWGGSGTGPNATRRQSKETIALSIWRCGFCSALAVTRKGIPASGKCGMCKQ